MGQVYLAPMEGLADFVLRDVLTRNGGFDGAVTEFVRISGSVLPLRSYRRICPELANGSRTPAGTPVAVQLLGSDPACMADNAAQLSTLNPHAIDLNFGCPAPTVNRHGGGALLLDTPECLDRITRAVRNATTPSIPVTAKMRLGVSHTGHAVECALALEAGGAASLVVHARTRDEGYRPPAHWEWIARIREAVHIPVIANGEVWTRDDYERCRAVSGCQDVMIGRGVVANPFLIRDIKRPSPETGSREEDWQSLLTMLGVFWVRLPDRVAPVHAPGRLKLWLNALREQFAGAEQLYRAIRPLRSVEETEQVMRSHGVVFPQAS